MASASREARMHVHIVLSVEKGLGLRARHGIIAPVRIAFTRFVNAHLGDAPLRGERRGGGRWLRDYSGKSIEAGSYLSGTSRRVCRLRIQIQRSDRIFRR